MSIMTKKTFVTERREQQFEELVNSHTSRVMKTVRALRPDIPEAAYQQVRTFVRSFLKKHGQPDATRKQAALHEAGHYVVYEAQGMIAGSAYIIGSPGGWAGWSGYALAVKAPLLQNRYSYTTQDVIDEARATIAGPWAEAVLGRSSPNSSVSEIIETHFLAARAAEMSHRESNHVLADIIASTAAIVRTFEEEIQRVASYLERRRNISYLDRFHSKVLANVSKIDINTLHSFDTDTPFVQDLTRQITELSGLDDLIRQVCGKGSTK